VVNQKNATRHPGESAVNAMWKDGAGFWHCTGPKAAIQRRHCKATEILNQKIWAGEPDYAIRAPYISKCEFHLNADLQEWW